jgi:hypothetical protein
VQDPAAVGFDDQCGFGGGGLRGGEAGRQNREAEGEGSSGKRSYKKCHDAGSGFEFGGPRAISL